MESSIIFAHVCQIAQNRLDLVAKKQSFLSTSLWLQHQSKRRKYYSSMAAKLIAI